MARTRVKTCTAGDRSRAALEASLRRFLDTAVKDELPPPPVGGEVIQPR